MATRKVEVAMDGAKATVEVKAPPKKLCSIKDVLPPSVIPLVQAAPNNDTIRNLLLAHLKVPVPKEEDTYEKVVKWIEFNVAKSPPPPPPKTDFDLMLERQEREDRQRRERQVMVMVNASEREHGRCSYHMDIEGHGEIPIDRDLIVSLASEAENAREFFEAVEEWVGEAGPNNWLNMNPTGRGDSYDDHDPDESTDQSVSIQEPGKQVLKDTLRAIDEELYRSLFPE